MFRVAWQVPNSPNGLVAELFHKFGQCYFAVLIAASTSAARWNKGYLSRCARALGCVSGILWGAGTVAHHGWPTSTMVRQWRGTCKTFETAQHWPSFARTNSWSAFTCAAHCWIPDFQHVHLRRSLPKMILPTKQNACRHRRAGKPWFEQ